MYLAESTLLTILIGFINIFEIQTGNINGIAVNNTLNLGYLASWAQGWIIGPLSGSGIVLGIEEVKRRQLLPGYEIEWDLRDTWCEPKQGTKMAVDLWASTEDLDALIGPGCSVACQSVGLLAAAWEIPLISWACTSASLSDKVNYPTLTRLEGSRLGRLPAYEGLVDMFGWKKVGIITTHEDLYRISSIVMMNEMQRNGKEVLLQVIEPTTRGTEIDIQKYNILQDIIRSMKERVRIFIFMAYTTDLRNMLIISLDLGMLNGDYAFISNEFVLPDINIKQTYRPEADALIWNGLLATGLKTPSGEAWDKFRQRVVDVFQDGRFDHMPHLPDTAGIDEVSVYAGNLHDSVLQWAYGVNLSLQQGYAPDDGFQISQNIFNMEFEGIGGTVVINDVGDRLVDLRAVSIQDNKRVVLMEWSSKGQAKKIYKPENKDDWSGVFWHGNSTRVPRDSPLCGWKGELCETEGDTNSITVIGMSASVAVFLAILSVIAAVSIRKQRRESTMKTVDAVVIKWQDLKLVDMGMKTTSMGSLRSASKMLQNQRKQLAMANYGDDMVVLRYLDQREINMEDKSVLKDLQLMRDVAHDNINAFVGLCTEIPNVCYLMLYAPRGTLQDILSDEDTKLSRDFKISFILDIACGMWYIHQSPLAAHGKLTSSKCLVNNRWTVKITGFGLKSLKQQYAPARSNKDINYSKLLWTAPEFLHNPVTMATTNSAVQQADVYSFAIIAQEVFLHDVPFGANEPELEPQEIIEKVKTGSTPFYRPDLPFDLCTKEYIQLMQQCWQENPTSRPSFNDVLVRINEIHKYKNMDLVDNMIKRLEKYTRDLEDRVAARSIELEGEKRKVETLLKELLPESVAEKLAAGKTINPETFDNVTIFFSDIVGFTKISSVATPLDIVVMLNGMYTLFDDVAQVFDVYKVATIGDAYVVASGVPIRNGNKHGPEICKLALALLDAIAEFAIPHMPNEHLRMRIGIHSGACVAGVVGVKMPRYLLFGETVEIAAKMESGSEPMKIQISETTKDLVHSSREFTVIKREDKKDSAGFWLEK